MLDPTPASPCPICRRLRALACLSVLGLCASPAGALPALEPGPAPGPLLAQGEPPGSAQRAQDDRQAPFDALNQVLEDTRAKLEELAEAAATVAADTDLRKELPALERDNELGRRTRAGEHLSDRTGTLERTRRGAHCRAHGSRRQGTSGGGAHR
jgi:hypothetical protein